MVWHSKDAQRGAWQKRQNRRHTPQTLQEELKGLEFYWGFRKALLTPERAQEILMEWDQRPDRREFFKRFHSMEFWKKILMLRSRIAAACASQPTAPFPKRQSVPSSIPRASLAGASASPASPAIQERNIAEIPPPLPPPQISCPVPEAAQKKRQRHQRMSEEWILAFLQRVQAAGRGSVKEICEQESVPPPTYYLWRRRYQEALAAKGDVEPTEG